TIDDYCTFFHYALIRPLAVSDTSIRSTGQKAKNESPPFVGATMAEPSQSVRQASAGRRSHHKLTGIWRVAFGGRMLAALPFDVDGSTFGLFQEARLSFALSALSRIVVCALAAVLLSPSLAVAQTPSPFRGTPSAIPGIIQAEDFDLGGQGVAYNDTTATNDGTQYRSEGPDIFSFANPDAPPEPNNFVI